MFSTIPAFLALSGLLALASGHVVMVEPKQWYVPEIIRETIPKSDGPQYPLQEDGSNFPCHGVTPEAPVATYLPGASQPLKLKGSAVHGGGSGQMSITYDTKPTKNTIFRVMTSYMGDHPIKADENFPEDADLALYPLSPLSFKIPEGMPMGRAVVAWTWFNRLGNREMYMQCATVVIGGTETSTKVFDSLPEIFKANIQAGTCKVENGVTAILFQSPGPEIFGKGITPIPCGESPRNAAGGSSGNGGSPSPSSSGAQGAPSTPANSTGSYTKATGTPTTMPQGSLCQPTTFSTSAKSVTIPPAPSNTRAAYNTTLGACTEGEVTCNSDGTWSMCGSGRVQNMGKTAAGMVCKDGKMVRIGSVRHRRCGVY